LRINKANTLAEIKKLTDIYSQCIHCGLCLISCPTYELTRLETSSPRGRIKLIKSVSEGSLPVTETFAYEMNFCLDCQACETACPAGVKYGKMVETARVEIENNGYSSLVKSFFLKHVLPYKNRIKTAASVLRLYQKSGLQRLLRLSGLLKYLSPVLAGAEELLPVIPDRFSDSFINEINEPSAAVKYRVAFSNGCLMNVMLPEVNRDTVELLKKTGAVVISPHDQTCCGSLNAHNGDMATAKKLAAENIKAFSKYEFDYLVSNSAGCGAFMKEYGELFRDDNELAVNARRFSFRVKDLTEYLSETGLPEIKNRCDKDVTYHDACHLVHTQQIYNQPRALLNELPGVNIVPLEDSTKCCGSAGIYNIIHRETSEELLKMKLEKIHKSKAGIVLTGNPGCMIQIGYGLKKYNSSVKVEHIASLLNRMF
jgi:glycolate oxidase iron-sulfur subunit